MILLCWAIQIYIFICIVRVVFSFLDLRGQNNILASVGDLSVAVTEPVFRMVRGRMPRFGDLPIDFSPAIVIIVLGVLRTIVCSI